MYMSDAITIVDGLATAYSQTGKGPDVLLLHGWGDSRKTFLSLNNSLQDKYRVTSLDLPGFGGTEPPKKPWDLTDYAKFLNSFVKKLGLKPKVVLGHSNGGALAIHALATQQLHADKLVLLAASGVRSNKRLKRAATQIVAKTGKLVTIWMPLATRQKLQMTLYGTIGSDMLVAPQLKETFKRTVRQDVQTDAQKLNLPSLLIYGSSDKATAVAEVGNRLAECIQGSTLKVIAGAGHFVHHDASAEVENFIQEFLA